MPGPCQVRNLSSEVIPNKLTQSIQGVMALRLFSDHQASPQLPAHHRSSMGSEIVYILQVLSHSRRSDLHEYVNGVYNASFYNLLDVDVARP